MLGHRQLNVQDYLGILKRRWWIIAIPTIILPFVAIGATYFIAPRYVSQAVMLIDQQKVPTDFVQPVASQDLDSRLALITAQVLSRANIQPIVEKYNLFANQHLSMDQRIDLIRDPASKVLKIAPVPTLLSHSNGLPGFSITFTANDPQTAQQVCTEITALFTKNNLLQQNDNAEGTADFLKTQIDSTKHTLDDMDAKVAAFQRQYAGMLPEDQTNNMSIMASLNSELQATTQQLQNLEQNRSVAQALLTQQEAVQAAAASPNAVPAQTSEAQQKQLSDLLAQKTDLEARYSADYPDVKDVNRKIADLRRQMAQAAAAPAPASVAPAVKRPDSASVVQLAAQMRGMEQQIEDKRKQQDQIQQQIRGYQGRISASPQIESQYKELTRDYETEQATYDKLLAELNQSQMTTSMQQRQEGENFSLLDAANLPTDPIWPKVSIFMAGGLVAGLGLGLMIAALLEYRDTALRTERDVWDFTQLPTLAVIAWSGDIADVKTGRFDRLKRLFSRKPSKDLLADSTG